MSRPDSSRAAGWLIADVLVLCYALVPVLWVLSLSLKPTSSVKDGKFFPWPITLDNYRGIFSGNVFTSALVNSIGIGLIATVIAVSVGTMAAYAVARLDFPGKKALIGAALLIAMFPQISLVTPIFNIERSVGLFDTWPGLIIPYITFALPLAIYTLSAFFREIPGNWRRPPRWTAPPRRSLLESHCPVGHARHRHLRDLGIHLRVERPAAGDLADGHRPIHHRPVAIANFTGSSQFEEPTGSIAAGAIVITVPIIIFVLIFQRRIVAGLTSGAVKG